MIINCIVFIFSLPIYIIHPLNFFNRKSLINVRYYDRMKSNIRTITKKSNETQQSSTGIRSLRSIISIILFLIKIKAKSHFQITLTISDHLLKKIPKDWIKSERRLLILSNFNVTIGNSKE